MKKKIKYAVLTFIVLIFSFFAYVIISTPFFSILNISNTLNATIDVVESINIEKKFGKFVYANYDSTLQANDGTKNQIKVDLKLFNLITIKSFFANTQETELYVGGDTVGFSLNGEGVIIIGFGDVETSNGKVCTTENSGLKKGDIILELQNEKVNSVAEITRTANKNDNIGKELDVKIKRGEKIFDTKIISALDKNSNLYKLGLWVKDDVSGIGTLTYIRVDNKRFGALGHAICDNDNKTVYNMNDGEMYPCTILGLKKGTKGKAGELRGLFFQGKNNKIGNVDKNTEFGVFGEYIKNCDKKDIVKAGGRLYVKPGKAYIRSSIDGETTKDYEIEIVKTNYQSSSNEKSMVIRVTDKELLSKTGGIIQGMSGSPIIQNDRVVGAVTHVFINDPTKGFAVYLDWMINQ